MSGGFEVRRNFSAVYTHCCWLRYSFHFVIVVKKIYPNFPLSAFLLHKSNFVKDDQNFAVKALCAPWFPSLVSLLFVATPSVAMKLEQPISVRCNFDVKFKFYPNHKPEKWDDNTALYCRLSRLSLSLSLSSLSIGESRYFLLFFSNLRTFSKTSKRLYEFFWDFQFAYLML